jgi:hypothetical protein
MFIKFYIKALLNGFSFKRAVKQANLDNRTIPDFSTKEQRESLLNALRALNKHQNRLETTEELNKRADRYDKEYDKFSKDFEGDK